jgi:Rrf2 family protein
LKLTTRSRYGTRLILELAEHYREGPIQLGTIAKRQDLSLKYLEQLVIPLRRAGYIRSVRGVKGGFELARPPQEITVREVVNLFENDFELVDCVDHPEVCERSSHCRTRLLWLDLTLTIREKLTNYTFADLMNRFSVSSLDPAGDEAGE